MTINFPMQVFCSISIYYHVPFLIRTIFTQIKLRANDSNLYDTFCSISAMKQSGNQSISLIVDPSCNVIFLSATLNKAKFG